MIPLPTAKIFRSRRAALWWSFWVIVAAVTTIGVAPVASRSDAGSEISQADVQALASLLNAN